MCRALQPVDFDLAGCFALVDCLAGDFTIFPDASQNSIFDRLLVTVGSLAFSNTGCPLTNIASSFIIASNHRLVMVAQYSYTLLTANESNVELSNFVIDAGGWLGEGASTL